jgi:hypothetical protein
MYTELYPVHNQYSFVMAHNYTQAISTSNNLQTALPAMNSHLFHLAALPCGSLTLSYMRSLALGQTFQGEKEKKQNEEVSG